MWIDTPEEILRISPYSVRIPENTNQNNSEYGHFLHFTQCFFKKKYSQSTFPYFHNRNLNNCINQAIWRDRLSRLLTDKRKVRIWSYSGGPYFPTLRLNTEKQSVSLLIQSKCRKIRTRITPNTGTYYILHNVSLKRSILNPHFLISITGT